MRAGSRLAACLCVVACLIGASSESQARISYRLGWGQEFGYFPDVAVKDPEGKPWDSFSGHALLGMVTSGDVCWGRASLQGLFVTDYLSPFLGKNFGTDSLEQTKKAGGLSFCEIGVGYTIALAPWIELRPVIAYGSAVVAAKLELKDISTGRTLQEVDYEREQSGLGGGMRVSLWQIDGDLPGVKRYPRFQLEYTYLHVLDGMHSGRVSFRLIERRDTDILSSDVCGLLLLSASQGESASTFSMGFAIEAGSW